MSTDALWFAGRGTGVVTLVLFTIVVALGIATRSGRAVLGLPGFAVSYVHRGASLLGLAFLAIHVGSLLLDPYAQLRLLDVVFPFVAGYRPFWQGLGTVALDLMAALVITSLLRHRIGARTWRLVHWAAYAAWPVAVLHGLGTGTDGGQWWLRVITGGCVALVLACGCWRLSLNRTERAPASRHVPLVTPTAHRLDGYR